MSGALIVVYGMKCVCVCFAYTQDSSQGQNCIHSWLLFEVTCIIFSKTVFQLSLSLSLSLSLGILAYLGFGPYQDQGEKLWGQPLNYYLLPVMVSVYAIHRMAVALCVLKLCCSATDSDYSGLFHCVVHECLPHGSGHHLHLCL